MFTHAKLRLIRVSCLISRELTISKKNKSLSATWSYLLDLEWAALFSDELNTVAYKPRVYAKSADGLYL